MRKTTTATLTVIGMLLSLPALGADDQEKAWSDTAELSFVATDGNSESMSLGFKNTAVREWEKSSLTIRAGGIRVETTTITRTAQDGVVREDKDTETTAENYYLNGRYDRPVHDRLFWYAGAGWDRNEFAGIENRYLAEGGVGNTWRDTKELKLKTTYGLTYTDQEDVVDDPSKDDTFLGVRFSWDYLNKLGANTTFTNVLVLDENLDETSDWRVDMANGLAVAMNEHLALKLGLRLLYDNEPAIDLVDNLGTGPEQVEYELEELDTILTISLVADF
jgi:putative salt-induced outer membrane protein YdiY